ncbi:sugar ABC transporter ATP-binding protein [Xylanibacillus composti]|nr:sugar ABC transporter ATP-binding protein [Xylanibacillus composti]
MNSITKNFPGVQALKNVDFSVHSGEIHALLGANGAGKSTLMKILSGAYTPDSGTIQLEGREIAIHSPSDALLHGIICIYQEVDTALVGNLSVAENIFMDRMSRRSGSGWLRWGSIKREATAVLKRLGAEIPVTMQVDELSISQKQLVLIARAVVQQTRVVIFDEPTAPLSSDEAERLFAIMRQLKADGVACIFISHRLPEVFNICDRITVMRDGEVVSVQSVKETTIPAVIQNMLGRAFEEEFPKLSVPIGNELLRVENLQYGQKVRNVNFSLREGEILGIAGLVGAGKTELSRVLFGADRADTGSIRLNGRSHRFAEPFEAIQNGIVLVPEERRKQGILVDESVRDNLTVPTMKQFSRAGFLQTQRETEHARSMVEQLGVKTPHVQQKVGLLSGGNQQKVVVGKWLPTQADVYLFDEPTKGIDIGAKSDMFKLIGELAEQGKGIIYFSSELAEILGIADRILVMCDGRIVKELTRDEATQDTIMYYASGGTEAEDNEQ